MSAKRLIFILMIAIVLAYGGVAIAQSFRISLDAPTSFPVDI